MDKFCEDHEVEHIDLLKIDTEGNELSVLKGCSRILREKRVDYIHFEFNEMNIESRVFFRDFLDLLKDYNLYRLLPHGFLEIKYSPIANEVFAYQNIVAVRNDCQF